MNKRVKDMWLKALRSGEFKQVNGYLEKDGCYCALGVLSVLSLVEGYCTYNVENGIGSFDQRKFSLSYNVMKWAGIAQEDNRFLDEDEHEVIIKMKDDITSISELNDSGKSFKQIALIIERYL